MKNAFKRVAAGLFMLGAVSSANAAVIISMQMGGGDPYWNDYDVIFGLGSTATPDWQVQVAWDHSSGQAFDASGTASYDITSLFDNAGGQTWWVLADDNWGANYSYLTSLTIDTGSQVYTSTDTPIYIPDNGQAYAFVTIPRDSGVVPEPATMSLLGLGLLGFAAARRHKTA